jgi:dTDP-4-amino-4,6-dideoxygalactose transaminase
MPNSKIFITSPLIPKISDFNKQLKDIWKSKWLTNMGQKHNLLERKLENVLKVKNISLFNNGTIALLTALKALNLNPKSEVITTPFTFPATAHCIMWNDLTPVFCDVNPDTFCIDADKIEKLITKKTSAILAVHVYGFPCEVEKIEKIAKKHKLKVIYDAAHAFTTEINGRGIGTFGDITMFSFHATKLFNTIEGGCLTYNDSKLKNKIYNLRNFGIEAETVINEIGINGKMNELQAAFGLLNLKLFEKEKQNRKRVKAFYNKHLSKISGIRIPEMPKGVTNSYQYYPIVVEKNYPLTRDALCEKLKNINIIARKYFYPPCSDYNCYKNLPSARAKNLPVTNDIKNKVLCLPFYGDLSKSVLTKIVRGVNGKF